MGSPHDVVGFVGSEAALPLACWVHGDLSLSRGHCLLHKAQIGLQSSGHLAPQRNSGDILGGKSTWRPQPRLICVRLEKLRLDKLKYHLRDWFPKCLCGQRVSEIGSKGVAEPACPGVGVCQCVLDVSEGRLDRAPSRAWKVKVLNTQLKQLFFS